MNNSKLLKKYVNLTPTFRLVKKKYFNNHIKIDHIAHRSFNYKTLETLYNNQSFETQKDIYSFPKMNVTATWMKSSCSRVFLSQFNGDNKVVIKNFNDYLNIKQMNDYVAWTYIHKNDINHIAIEVDDIYEIVKKIRNDNLIRLNNEYNPIQISNDGNLLQASTISDKIYHKFTNGDYNLVPYTFVEFVQRKNNRDGFEVENAKEIFKSTNY